MSFTIIRYVGYTQHPFTSSQDAILYTAVLISSCLGIIGALLILITFVRIPALQKSAVSRIVAAMAVADLVSSSCKAFGHSPSYISSSPNGAACQAQAALIQWSDLSSVLWTMTIAVNLLAIMYLRQGVNSIQKFEYRYALLCYGFPAVLALIPLFVRGIQPNGTVISGYGDATLYCWIPDAFPVVRAILYYIPMWLIFTVNLSAFLLVGRVVWR
ncbi:slime mold cyclic AMP receptor-domain-containing protein, partial [Piptocephalis cylindrospora]